MIKTEYNHKDKILYAVTTGDITLREMIDMMRKMLTNDEHPRDLRILENAKNANAKFDLSDVKHLKNLIDLYSNKFKSINHAVVLSASKDTAMGIWFEENSLYSKYKLKVFSTEKAAKGWLNLYKP